MQQGQEADDADNCRCKDDIDDVYVEKEIEDESACHDADGEDAFFFCHMTAQVAGHVQDHGCHARLHAVEDGGHIGIGGKSRVEKGDDAQDHHGREDGSQDCREHPCKAADFPSHQNRRIDSHRPGTGLGEGGEVQHFLLIDPFQILHKLPPHKPHDHKPSPEGKGADVESGEKEGSQFSDGSWFRG